MCMCSLGNILDVGAEGNVKVGDVGAVGTVVQKDVGAYGTVNQKDVVAAGTVRNSVSGELADGRCAGDIPSSPGCAASRPHEHTHGGAVPSGTVSPPEVTKRPPGTAPPLPGSLRLGGGGHLRGGSPRGPEDKIPRVGSDYSAIGPINSNA